MANNQIKINRIAIWRATANLEEGKLNISKQPAGLPFLAKGSNVFQKSDQPMFRYVKNYSVGEVKFSLFVRTFVEESGLIEASLDKVAESIPEEFARKVVSDHDFLNFEYLDEFIKEDE